MQLDPQGREQIGNVMETYLSHSAGDSWATLWHRPSKLEPDLLRLTAVMDSPKAVKELSRVQSSIEQAMKSLPVSAGQRLYMEIIPTREFHLRYQSQDGYELIREWNGERLLPSKKLQLFRLTRLRSAIRFLLPLLIAALLYLVIRAVAQKIL